MPVPHFNIKITQRSKGNSAVAGAAYQAGEKLFSEYDQKSKDHRRKQPEVLYTEIMFPEKGVRFIAINNGVDSANPSENDFTPFLNIMNEWYAKDTSNKIRAIFRSRMQDGKRCSGESRFVKGKF